MGEAVRFDVLSEGGHIIGEASWLGSVLAHYLLVETASYTGESSGWVHIRHLTPRDDAGRAALAESRLLGLAASERGPLLGERSWRHGLR